MHDFTKLFKAEKTFSIGDAAPGVKGIKPGGDTEGPTFDELYPEIPVIPRPPSADGNPLNRCQPWPYPAPASIV